MAVPLAGGQTRHASLADHAASSAEFLSGRANLPTVSPTLTTRIQLSADQSRGDRCRVKTSSNSKPQKERLQAHRRNSYPDIDFRQNHYPLRASHSMSSSEILSIAKTVAGPRNQAVGLHREDLDPGRFHCRRPRSQGSSMRTPSASSELRRNPSRRGHPMSPSWERRQASEVLLRALSDSSPADQKIERSLGTHPTGRPRTGDHVLPGPDPSPSSGAARAGRLETDSTAEAGAPRSRTRRQ
jgi:hypothetical protein